MSEDDDYRMQHRAPGPDECPAHDLTQIMPEDVYTHPHYYDTGGGTTDRAFSESHAVVRKMRGKPEQKVHIYRAMPAEHVHKGFQPGDWVSLSKDYARQHAMQNDDPKHDWPVIRTSVPAKHLNHDGNDLNEFGYNGPAKGGMVSFKGGYHQEVRHDTEGKIVRVKRRAPKTAAMDPAKWDRLTWEHRPPSRQYPNEHSLWATHPKADTSGYGHSGYLGHISWFDDDGEVSQVNVHQKYRRQGLGRELWRRAQEISPHLAHSDLQTRDGQGWAQKVGRTVRYIRNPESSTVHGDFGEQYGQHIEPAGRYITERHGDHVPEGWESGEVHFRNPLHMDWGGSYSEPTNWKQQLHQRYDGRTGHELSRAIADDGHDGIITSDKYGTSEIVDLTHLHRQSRTAAHQTCPDCEGDGKHPWSKRNPGWANTPCPDCGGRGQRNVPDWKPPHLPEHQREALETKDWGEAKRKNLDIAKDRTPGTKVWRGEVRHVDHMHSPPSIGLHWSTDADQVVTQAHEPPPGHVRMIWEGEIEHRDQAFPRSHPMWGGQLRSMDSESEVRFKPGAQVYVHRGYVHDGSTPSTTFTPHHPERSAGGWSHVEVGQHVPIRHGKGGFSDYSEHGIHHEADRLPTLDGVATRGYNTDGWKRWQQGSCDAYAVGLTRLHPKLRFGVLVEKEADPDGDPDYDSYHPQHFFAHDDHHAYDSAGRHPLPYHGIHPNPHIEAWHDQHHEDWNEGSESDIHEAMEHAKAHGILEGRYGPHAARKQAKIGDGVKCDGCGGTGELPDGHECGACDGSGRDPECICGESVALHPIDGWQHADGSVSHDGPLYGTSVSEAMRMLGTRRRAVLHKEATWFEHEEGEKYDPQQHEFHPDSEGVRQELTRIAPSYPGPDRKRRKVYDEHGDGHITHRIKHEDGSTEHVPVTHVYRAVSETDFHRMREQGHLDTHGNGNMYRGGEHAEGMVASTHPWIHSYVPDHEPGRVLKIRVQHGDGWRLHGWDGPHYVHTPSAEHKIPWSRVEDHTVSMERGTNPDSWNRDHVRLSSESDPPRIEPETLHAVQDQHVEPLTIQQHLSEGHGFGRRSHTMTDERARQLHDLLAADGRCHFQAVRRRTADERPERDAHLLNFSDAEREEKDNGGTKWRNKGELKAHHPEHGQVGSVTYLRGSRSNSPLMVGLLHVHEDHQRKGYGTAIMDELQRQFPKARIDHGDRTDAGKAWWDSYGKGKADRRGRTAAIPTKRLFGRTFGLDHRLFEGDALKADVTHYVLSTLDGFWRPLYGSGWQRWARVYLAGSEASEWTSETLEGNNDFDVLVGIHYDRARTDVPVFAGMPDQSITDRLNAEFRELLMPRTSGENSVMITINGKPEGPFDNTFYVNPGSWNIADIKPYAAYDITNHTWAVRPPHLPDWDVSKFPEGHALVEMGEAYEKLIKAIFDLPEPMRTQQGNALWTFLHSDRSRAFSEQGEGWYDPGNAMEKWLDQNGVWKDLWEVHHRAEEDPATLLSPAGWSNDPSTVKWS